MRTTGYRVHGRVHRAGLCRAEGCRTAGAGVTRRSERATRKRGPWVASMGRGYGDVYLRRVSRV
eukprot:6371092-Prymnesium_polylepis.1